ncbi:BQ5605_C064g12784 [Microbotryum silenes-dioicae]|uniref:BQ5605_C040g11837 protein n=1 Tax=Microbotryum silenes-dioicae TaxID=796604 RepID=A0A2X0MQV9_9BASI|nr:BQ5605_C040g11837 [Microbotryum silenes-dioicae]SGZ35140.1 BQ5605_C064g12784 [Microbotryum silenes-dioicae]
MRSDVNVVVEVRYIDQRLGEQDRKAGERSGQAQIKARRHFYPLEWTVHVHGVAQV